MTYASENGIRLADRNVKLRKRSQEAPSVTPRGVIIIATNELDERSSKVL